MITDFNELRAFVTQPYYGNLVSMKFSDRLVYAQTMALIQTAQELNEIKNFLSLIGSHIEKMANSHSPELFPLGKGNFPKDSERTSDKAND